MTLYVLLTGRFPFSWPADVVPGDSHATRVQRMFARITTGSYMPLTGVRPPAPVRESTHDRCMAVLRLLQRLCPQGHDLAGDLHGDFRVKTSGWRP